MTDAAARAVFYEYDEVGRVTRVLRPDSQDVVFQYDDAGGMQVLTVPSNANHE